MQWKEAVVRGIEVAGLALILLGAILATVRFIAQWSRIGLDNAYREFRQQLGRAILLGREFLVAGDINTVAVDPSFRRLGILAGIVLIRTSLSFPFEVEIDGQWP